MPDAASHAWKRLGGLLVRRRVELDPRYSNRQAFSAERGVGYRTVSDIERGRRGNYDDSTIAAIEVAYAVEAGSVAAVLAGGELEPLPAPRAAVPESAPARWDDEPQGDAAWALFPNDKTKRHVWRTPNLSEEERAAIIAMVDRKRAEAAPPERQADAG